VRVNGNRPSEMANYPSKDRKVTEAITNAGIDVEITGQMGGWDLEIGSRMSGERLTEWIFSSHFRPAWDLGQALAEALLAMPLADNQ